VLVSISNKSAKPTTKAATTAPHVTLLRAVLRTISAASF
jgi:hypothetical protein